MFFPYQQKQNVFHYLVLDNKKAVYSFTERVVWTLKLIWRIEKKIRDVCVTRMDRSKILCFFFFGGCCWNLISPIASYKKSIFWKEIKLGNIKLWKHWIKLVNKLERMYRGKKLIGMILSKLNDIFSWEAAGNISMIINIAIKSNYNSLRR